jgi:hypothetical protein
MALLLTKDNRPIFVDAEKAATIWRVFNGELKGTKKQREFCARLSKIYLNKQNAPASYLRKYGPVIERHFTRAQQARLPYVD